MEVRDVIIMAAQSFKKFCFRDNAEIQDLEGAVQTTLH